MVICEERSHNLHCSNGMVINDKEEWEWRELETVNESAKHTDQTFDSEQHSSISTSLVLGLEKAKGLNIKWPVLTSLCWYRSFG